MQLINGSHSEGDVIRAARAHLRARRWQDADGVACRCLRQDPANGEALAIRGLVCLATGRVDEAQSLIESAVTQSPQSGFAYFAFAHLYFSQNKADQAEVCLKRSLVLSPLDDECICFLGNLLMARGECSQSEQLLLESVKKIPESALLRLSLAECSFQAGDIQNALVLITECLELDQKSAPAWIFSARLVATQGTWSEAIHRYEQALLLDPNNPDYLLEFAGLLLLAGGQSGASASWLTAAEAAARDVITLVPQSIPGQRILGAVLRALRRFDEALKIQSSLVRLLPKEVMPALEIAITQREARNFESALVAVKHAISLAPTDPSGHFVLGDLLLLKGELADALVVFEEADLLLRPAQSRLPVPLDKQLPIGKELVFFAPHMQPTILYARYAPLLAQMGVRASFVAPAELHEFLASIQGVGKLYSVEAELPDDVMVEPITRLPVLLGHDVSLLSGHVPYYFVDELDLEALKSKFNELPASRIGLNLGESPDPKLAEAVAQALRGTGVTLVTFASLGGTEAVFAGIDIEYADMSKAVAIATLLKAVSCLISVDSTLVHMAGAIGAPCHLLLPLRHDALWGGEGTRSEWYPSIHIHREVASTGWADSVDVLKDYVQALYEQGAMAHA